jgi:poly(hydroxyalkanoate) granule-associated protein
MTMTKPQPKRGNPQDAVNAARAASENVMDSAHQIWLAGLGAFAKAHEEGGKWFEALVKEGAALDAKTRQHTEASARELRGNVESAVDNVRERTLQTWDKLEKVFESRVSRAIEHLGVPGQEELQALMRRVEELSRELRKLADKPTPAKTEKTKRPAR